MSTKEKQSFALYFLLAFGLAWLCQVYGSLLLLRDGNAAVYRALLSVSMFCPLVAVLVAKRIVLHQPTGIGWKVRGKRRYWLAAWFGPAVFTVLAALLYFAVFSSRLDLSGSWLVTAYGGEMDAETLRSQLGVSNLSYLLETGLFAITLAPPINMLFAVGEEAGWRGYMMPQLKECFGLLNGRLLGGVIWGVWHWPIMLLTGYEYGTNYLGAPVLGLVVWCVVCFALNTLLDWLYEKTGCIWVSAIAHGAFNAVAALFTVLTYPADAYYNVLGPTPIGLIGMLPMLAAAVWLTLRQVKQEEMN
jgi:membrane protease YdiL (CAAX protease family)